MLVLEIEFQNGDIETCEVEKIFENGDIKIKRKGQQKIKLDFTYRKEDLQQKRVFTNSDGTRTEEYAWIYAYLICGKTYQVIRIRRIN